MCQLTFINTRDPKLNSLVVSLMARRGGNSNPDGTGIMYVTEKGVISHKTKNPSTILDWVEISEKMAKESIGPLAAHIRKASKGTVNDENAHPFSGNKYLLMHNGTLKPEDSSNSDEDVTDSLMFLREMEKIQGDIPEVLNGAMEKFTGKFAFIILTREGKFYIARGKTATLYKSTLHEEGREIGFVVNTSEEVMDLVLPEVSLVYKTICNRKITYSKPELIEGESIFDENLAKIGTIKEKVTVSTPTYSWYAGSGWGNRGNSVRFIPTENDLKIVEMGMKLYRASADVLLSFLDVQAIFLDFFGVSILDASEKEIREFIDEIITPLATDEKVLETAKWIRKEFKVKFFKQSWYEELGIDYPWVVNDMQKVRSLLEEKK